MTTAEKIAKQIENICIQKAREEREEHRTYYPPRNGWEDGTWYNDDDQENATKEEATDRVYAKAEEMMQEILENGVVRNNIESYLRIIV